MNTSDEHENGDESHISRAAAQRLSQYLRCLDANKDSTVASEELAHSVGVSAAQVRRDLAALGHLGRRGIGYDSAALSVAIRKALGIDRTWRAVLVGVGNLARALLRYKGFREQGFVIVGLFDNDQEKVGKTFEGLTVHALTEIPEQIRSTQAELAILTVPSEPAQSVADLLIQSGIKGLLNFAPVLLKSPPGIRIVTVDLAIQLEQLAFLVQLRDGFPPATD